MQLIRLPETLAKTGLSRTRLYEAMAAGTPVVTYPRGSMPELIKHGETGYLCESEDEMVDVLDRIGSLDRGRCRNWAEEHFSVEQMVDGYERLYKMAVGGQWPRARQ